MSAIRYVFVGVIVYLIDMAGFILSLKLGLLYPFNANLFGKMIGGTFGFFAHRYFTFRIKYTQHYMRHAIKYFVILIISALFSSLVLKVCIVIIHYPIISKLCSDCLCITLSYLLTKYVVFHHKVK